MSSSTTAAAPRVTDDALKAPPPSAGAGGSRTTTATPRATPSNNLRGARYKTFSIGNLRFRVMSRESLMDSIMDGLSWALESTVYLIGPLLIVLALAIISLLTYSFVTILLPMIRLKHADSSLEWAYVALHCLWVCFLLVNVLFNYYLCVTTKHSGPRYDRVVRELAEATNMVYPETPAQIVQYRRDYEDRMVLRMRRRQARAAAAVVDAETGGGASSSSGAAAANSGSGGGVTQRKVSATASPAAQQQQQQPPPSSTQPKVRMWMLMGPLEWGFCGNSNQPKPPRSHYDHVTKQLILNLDHYCPWMFNSIGYFNYRYFVNFLVYIFLGMIYGAILTWEPFFNLSTREYRQQLKHVVEHQRQGFNNKPERLSPMLPYREEKTLLTLSFMLCAAVGFAIMLLGGFHIYLTCTAQTTVEFHANWANRRRAKRAGQKWQNPYSVGSAGGNFDQVYGKRRHPWFLALLPSVREPDYLPVPIPGHDGLRRHAAKEKTSFDEDNGGGVLEMAANGGEGQIRSTTLDPDSRIRGSADDLV